jgi:4-hydroxy-3-polyprenylbenzoate decarboxylase
MSDSDRLVVAITGASGIQYAQKLVQVIVTKGLESHVVFSDSAFDVWKAELDIPCDPKNPDMKKFCGADGKFRVYKNSHVGAPIASGSFRHRGMVIVPCTMSTLGRVATGSGEGLIGRAAEVTLKERRKLIIVPRETPYSLIALRNMVQLTEAGAVIVDANPGFYTRPKTAQDMVDFVVARVLDQLGIEHDLIKRWGEKA